MKTKHSNKNWTRHKFLFFTVGIAISILAVFSICVTQKALAEDAGQEKNGIKLTLTWDYVGESNTIDVVYEYQGAPMETYPVNKGDDLNALAMVVHGEPIDWFQRFSGNNILMNLSSKYKFLIAGATLPDTGNWYFDGNLVPEIDQIQVGDKDHVLYFTDKAPVVSCNINGIVSDADNLNPIAGASVVYASNSASNYTVSDTTKDDGSYSLTIEDDNYLPGKLVVKVDGYDEYTKNISKEDFVEGIYELPISITKTATPEPQPQAEISNSTAQTGDSWEFAIISLTIVALVSGGYIVRKQFVK